MTVRGVTSFTSTTGARSVVVEATGELDTTSVAAFREALEAAVRADLPLVVVDLGRVTFLDSAGLSVVFGVQRTMPPPQRLVLGNVPQRMLRTLRLAGVVAVVEVHPQGEPQPWRDADPASDADS